MVWLQSASRQAQDPGKCSVSVQRQNETDTPVQQSGRSSLFLGLFVLCSLTGCDPCT